MPEVDQRVERNLHLGAEADLIMSNVPFPSRRSASTRTPRKSACFCVPPICQRVVCSNVLATDGTTRMSMLFAGRSNVGKSTLDQLALNCDD